MFITILALLQNIPVQETSAAGYELIIHRTENCSCCKEYEKYLRAEGISFRTNIIDSAGLDKLKRKLGIPAELHSCHTAQIGPYFIEGHVPAEAIRKLSTEKPDLDGVAVPAMPPGSPGMGGVKTQPLEIYAKKGGEVFVWMVF